MADPFELLVGLGNPGPRYEATRHNAGFWLADAVARRCGASFRAVSRFAGEVAEARVGGHPIRLLKPTTYMNESGRSVAALARFYRIAPERILVAHDEIDLPPGTVRIKRGGGDGGHRGLRSVIPAVGGGFTRIRIGVGHPGDRHEVVSYVLRRAPAEEQRLLDEAVAAVVEQIEPLVTGEVERVMNVLHRRREPESEPAADRGRAGA